MPKPNLANVKSISTWNSGGDVEIDVIKLKNGHVLGITGESVVLYKDMEDLENGAAADRPAIHF